MDPKMQPAGEAAPAPGTPTRAASVAISFNQVADSNGNVRDIWTFNPDEVHMLYDKAGEAPDTITFTFSDGTRSGYKMAKFEFRSGGNPVAGVIDDWNAGVYANCVTMKTFNDSDHNTSSSDLEIDYCVTIMKADGSIKKNDPKIWNTKGSG